jgi:hypothetical protein
VISLYLIRAKNTSFFFIYSFLPDSSDDEYEKAMPLDIEKERIFFSEIKHLYDTMEIVLDGIRNKYIRKIIASAPR